MTYEYRGNTLDKSGWNSSGPAAAAKAETRAEREPKQKPERAPRRTGGRSPAQVLAAVFGLVFLLVGIAGFIPGITSHTGDLALAGTDSQAELLGLFRVSVLHNVVHLLFGVGLLAAARPAWARLYLLGGGIVYFVVAVYGLVVEESGSANFLPVNTADTWLHVGLSVSLLAAGVVTVLAGRRSAS